MNNRPTSDQPEITSACKILQKMLKHSAIKQRHHVHGGMGMSTSGNLVHNIGGSVETYDADTNALIRAICM